VARRSTSGWRSIIWLSGTISLRPSTFQAAILDWVDSLSRHGFERLYFFNGHGGNIASIEAAFSEGYARYSFSGKACPSC